MKKFLFFSVLFFLILWPASVGFNLWWGKRNLIKTKTFLLTGSFDEARRAALSSSRSFKRAGASLVFDSFFQRLTRLNDWLEASETVAQLAFHLARAGESIEEMFAIAFKGEEKDLKAISDRARIEFDLSWRELSLLEAFLKKKPLFEPPQIKEKIKAGREVLAIVPEILGLDRRKTYLLLIQNNLELRPTGGFIGSYGLVTFENGKLLDFQTEDVSVVDQQLRGRVEPPDPIKKYLGETSWYLRDSNFNPDFSKTAQKAKWFFQKETGRVVDGVVAVNLFSIQKLLKAIGPIYLPEYQETITAENLLERVMYHNEVRSFSDSIAKKNFLTILSQQLFQKIILTKEWLKIAEALFSGLEEKQILLNFEEKKISDVFARLNWDGRILTNNACFSFPACVADYLMIVESNFGVNQVNYFLKRNLIHRIDLGKEIEEEVVINYQNTSPSQTWPSGGYRNYLRFFVPFGSRLIEAKIGELSLGFDQIDISSTADKTVFGFLVEIPAGERRTVVLRYKLPFILQEINRYSLIFQKQSGIDRDSLAIFVDYPSSVKVSKISPDALTEAQKILYNTDLSQDRVLIVEFSQ